MDSADYAIELSEWISGEEWKGIEFFYTNEAFLFIRDSIIDSLRNSVPVRSHN